MDRRARCVVQYAISLLGMQRNDVEGRREFEHVHSNWRRILQSPSMVDVQGVFPMSSEVQCAICQCVLFEGDETFETIHGIVDVLCYRSLEILGRVWS